MNVRFSSRSLPECLELHAQDAKLDALIQECRRHPVKGSGKPEPPGGDLSGWWSRRISHGHRLEYRVAGSSAEQMLKFAHLRYRY